MAPHGGDQNNNVKAPLINQKYVNKGGEYTDTNSWTMNIHKSSNTMYAHIQDLDFRSFFLPLVAMSAGQSVGAQYDAVKNSKQNMVFDINIEIN